VLAPSGSLPRCWMLTEQMTRAQAAGPAPLMRSAPRPSPVLFQWVTTSSAHLACWQTPRMAWRTAPLSYRLDPLALAAARYSGSNTTRTAGCSASSAWMAYSSPPTPGAASRGTRKHSRSKERFRSATLGLALTGRYHEQRSNQMLLHRCA
jgi:hypothetical protein